MVENVDTSVVDKPNTAIRLEGPCLITYRVDSTLFGKFGSAHVTHI